MLRRHRSQAEGGGMALAGIICGGAALLLVLLLIGAALSMFAIFSKMVIPSTPANRAITPTTQVAATAPTTGN